MPLSNSGEDKFKTKLGRKPNNILEFRERKKTLKKKLNQFLGFIMNTVYLYGLSASGLDPPAEKGVTKVSTSLSLRFALTLATETKRKTNVIYTGNPAPHFVLV